MSGLIFFIPQTYAANPLLQNITYSPTPFYITASKAVLKLEYDFNSGLTTAAPVIEQILDDQNNIVYEFGVPGADLRTSGHYKLEWDGKYKNGSAQDSKAVPDGKYKIYLLSVTASSPAAIYISPLFDLAKAQTATLTLVSSPQTIYLTNNSSDFVVNYHLVKGSAQFVAVGLKLFGPLNAMPSEQIVVTTLNSADSDYSVKWNGFINGKPATPGNYNWSLFALSSINEESLEGTTLTGTLKVRNPDASPPNFSNLDVKPAIFDPKNGRVTLNYTLNNTLGYNTITVGAYKAGDLNNPIKSWSFINQINGTYAVSWDGMEANSKQVADGSYIFKISGMDTGFLTKTTDKDEGVAIASQQINFTVNSPPPVSVSSLPPPNPPSGSSSASSSVQSGPSQPATTTSLPPNDIKSPANPNPAIAPALSTEQISEDNCAGFVDIDPENPDCDAVKFMKNTGAITGHNNNQFASTGLLQRDQVLKIILELLKKFDKKTDYCLGRKPFPDISSNNWAYQYVCNAKAIGLITGYKSGPDAGFYRPERPLTGSEFSAILSRGFQGQFGNNANSSKFIKRIEVARIIYKLHQAGKI